ncbi:MAG TPA: lysylphosphatidylglycerol synthase transmembrane domain-containing protein [Gemmatimonadales bacterium]|nr:lysylphosphatidylglycerol synthase transmembrane domain-containing protein [Gemmatimonadales bacterium]
MPQGVPLASDGRRAGWGRRVRPVAGLLVAAGFLVLAFRRLDWTAVAAAWRHAAVLPLVAGLALLALDFGLRIVRWWLMLRASAPALPARACIRPYLLSLAANNTMPLRAGDFIRAFGFREQLGTPPMRVLGTLVVERVLDLLTLLMLLFLGLWGVGRGALPALFVTAALVAGLVCLAGLLVLMLAPTHVRRLLHWLLGRGPLGARLPQTRGWAEQFLDAFTVLQSPRRAAELVGLSFLAWLCEGGLYAGVALALGVRVPPLAPWFALATGTLATLLPSSPGYVGTFDYFAMLGLRAYGAGATGAAAFALLVHLLLWAPVTLAGALLLLRPRGRLALARGRHAAEAT